MIFHFLFLGNISVFLTVKNGFLSVSRELPNIGKFNSKTYFDKFNPDFNFPQENNFSSGIVISENDLPIQIHGNTEKINNILQTLKFVSTDNYKEYGFIYINIVNDKSNENVTSFTQNQNDNVDYTIRVYISPINHPLEIIFVNAEKGIFYGNLDLHYNVDSEDICLNQSTFHQNNGNSSKYHLVDDNVLMTDINNIIDNDNNNNDNNDNNNNNYYSQIDVIQIDYNQQFQIGKNIQITDIDITQKNGHKLKYLVSLSTKYGNLKIQNADYIVFFRNISNAKLLNGNNDHSEFEDFNNGKLKSVVFRGTFFNIQNALQSTVYTPILNWFGVDVISINIIDLGNSSVII